MIDGPRSTQRVKYLTYKLGVLSGNLIQDNNKGGEKNVYFVDSKFLQLN